MMAQPAIQIEGLQKTLRAFSKLDENANAAAKREVTKISQMLAREIAGAGRRQKDRRSQHVATTVRAKKDRLPEVHVGKVSRMPVSRKGQGPRAYDLLYGMEFGSSGIGGKASDLPTVRGGRPGWRFPERTPRRGRSGNVGTWIYPTLELQQPRVLSLWTAALDKAAKDWAK